MDVLLLSVATDRHTPFAYDGTTPTCTVTLLAPGRVLGGDAERLALGLGASR